MSLDTPLRAVAKKILATFGTSSAIRRVTGTAYNTTTRTMTPTTADTTWKVRVDEFTDRELGSSLVGSVAGTIRAGDRKVTGAAVDLGFTPTVDDKWVYQSQVWDIIRVEPVLATDLAAIHVLQVRR